MKKLFILILLSAIITSNAQVSYPDYKAVHNRFYSRYTNEYQKEPVDIKFGKKVDGWYVLYGPYKDLYDKQSIKFWDKETNTWSNLPFDKSFESYKPIKESHISYMYRVSPLYGYPGWYNDVIDSLADKTHLSDTLYYALSKAYFHKYSASFGNQYGDYDPADILAEKTFPNAFSSDDMIELKKRHANVMRITKKMLAQNPKFETYVGSLNIQYGNDMMDLFMRVYLYQNPNEALPLLEKDVYDVYMLDIAKYYLMTCPPNAILFTNGDNDTYPLWYVQYALGIRKDVSVINISLLGLKEYVSMIRKLEIVQFNFNEKNVNDPLMNVVVTKDRTKPVSDNEFQQFLQADPDTLHGYAQITGGVFPFTIEGKEYSVKFNYLFLSDIIMLDIMHTNWGKRPICFTSIDSKYNSLLYDSKIGYLAVKTVGLTRSQHGQQLLNIWDKDFVLSDYSQVTDHFSSSHERILGSIIFDIASRCNALVKDGKLKEANAIATRVHQAYSSPYITRGLSWMYLAVIFGKTGDSKTAELIMDQVIKTETIQANQGDDDDKNRLQQIIMLKDDVVNGEFGF